MRLLRRRDRIYLQHRNTRFTADEGSPMRVSVDGNTAHSVVAAWDIESQHDSTGNVLVDVTKFLVSDYPNIGRNLRFYFDDKPATLDAERSWIDEIRAFPIRDRAVSVGSTDRRAAQRRRAHIPGLHAGMDLELPAAGESRRGRPATGSTTRASRDGTA